MEDEVVFLRTQNGKLQQQVQHLKQALCEMASQTEVVEECLTNKFLQHMADLQHESMQSVLKDEEETDDQSNKIAHLEELLEKNRREKYAILMKVEQEEEQMTNSLYKQINQEKKQLKRVVSNMKSILDHVIKEKKNLQEQLDLVTRELHRNSSYISEDSGPEINVCCDKKIYAQSDNQHSPTNASNELQFIKKSSGDMNPVKNLDHKRTFYRPRFRSQGNLRSRKGIPES